MKPRGPLMIEHRLIEKMLKVVEKEIAKIERTGNVDPLFIDTAVDFIRTYADRTHHGKEEDILFRDLRKKELAGADARGMQELVDEHVFARRIVGELVEAKNRFVAGDREAAAVVLEKLAVLAKFYPEHIKKEDIRFFPDTEKYFTRAELDAMLAEFWEFDRTMIHEKYRKLVNGYEGAC